MSWDFFDANGNRLVTDSVAALDNVGDVVITGVADNEVLAYDNGSGTWINQTAAEASLAAATHNHGTNGVVTKQSTANVTVPPTIAELTAAFGAPGTVGDGFIAVLDDNGAGAAVYLVAVVNGAWLYVALTAAA